MNRKSIKEFALYFIVGGIATVTEWVLFFVLERCLLHYVPATVVAYLLSTFVNWLAGRILVFKKSSQPIFKEILGIYLVSIVGLLLNLLVMWLAVDLFSLHEMISKMLATALVFFYNFIMRKLCIYRP